MIDEFLRLPLAALERLFAAVRAGKVRAPVTETLLLAEYLDVVRPHIGLLARFESDLALATFLECVVAQRRAADALPRPALVWSGPEPIHSQARRTSVVVREMFDKAKHEVFIAGYSFQGGDELLAPLHAAMRERKVTVQIVLDCSQLDVYEATDPKVILGRVVQDFWTKVWVHGEPRPSLLYDLRTLKRSVPHHAGRWFPEHSMHAKCIVVDGEEALVGSANFTERAQSSNIEVGVAIRERSFARALLHQWNAVRSLELIEAVTP